MSKKDYKPFGIDEDECWRMTTAIQPWLDDGLKGADEDIIDILKMFNTVDGVVTRWSCGGHEHEGRSKASFYIMFNLTESGLLWLEHWFGHLMRKTLEELEEIVHLVSLKKTYRLKGDKFHEVVILGANGLKDSETHKRFLDLVRSTLVYVEQESAFKVVKEPGMTGLFKDCRSLS